MNYLGIDFGGGSSKATLIDQTGRVLATASSEYQTTYKSDGTATQNPKDWLAAALANIRSILQRGFDPSEIEAVCFSAATHTAVLLDDRGEVICDSIYWTDTRSVREKQELTERYFDKIFRECKHKPDTIWTLPELMYLRKTHPEFIEKTAHLLFAKDYVRHFFTGDYRTDYIEAEGSMMFSFDRREWDEELVALTGLSKAVLPSIGSPLETVGTIAKKASSLSGLSENTKVILGSTDTAMELFASGGVKEGDMTIKLATAGRICLVSSRAYPDPNIINYHHLDGVHFYPGSGTKSCAASFRWFRDSFGGSFQELDALAEAVPMGSEGLIFHPYLTGELTPYGNSNIRGSYFGISALHGKGHFVRALYEGVAYSLLDCYLCLKEKGLALPKKAFALGGGTNSSLWRQIVSDVLGVELVVTKTNDSSFGGALSAAIACGQFPDFVEASETTRQVVAVVKPNEEAHRFYLSNHSRYRRISEFTLEFYAK